MPRTVPIGDFLIRRSPKLPLTKMQPVHFHATLPGNFSASVEFLAHYSTVSLKLTLCTSVPLVAVTTTLEIPAAVAVEGGGVGVVGVVPLLPPPHPMAVIETA